MPNSAISILPPGDSFMLAELQRRIAFGKPLHSSDKIRFASYAALSVDKIVKRDDWDAALSIAANCICTDTASLSLDVLGSIAMKSPFMETGLAAQSILLNTDNQLFQGDNGIEDKAKLCSTAARHRDPSIRQWGVALLFREPDLINDKLIDIAIDLLTDTNATVSGTVAHKLWEWLSSAVHVQQVSASQISRLEELATLQTGKREKGRIELLLSRLR